ncbi:MAG: aminotransferase DegT [Bacteroidetes bacterium HGW-Bacteroidetes-4]|jgi:dTDP-4-amino-4,6-dideoxygalactose transaminase|nr:MAG: aminotransferase DegT [Bacteroidetes bacterium HGW-Bacteroidetes-4]
MINVTKTYLPDKEKYKHYVDRIYRSGWLTNNGQLLQELTEKLSSYFEAPYVLPVSNGTLALQIAFKALELKNQVITTPFSFVATTSSLVWEGLTPVFADIEPDTFCLNPNNIEALITPDTSAILPVHVFGNSCDIDAIQAIAEQNQLKIIYDAAHAFAVKYNNKSIVTYGDASILSFHSTKIFHTIEGGAIIFKDKEAFERAKLLINFGIAGYDTITSLGINCKMNEFQAAMGLCMYDEMEAIIASRQNVYQRYVDAFKNSSQIQLQKNNRHSTHNFAYFPIVFKTEENLLRVKEVLAENKIFARRYFYPSLESLPYLKTLQKVPFSSSLSKRILCLPIYESLDVKDQELIIHLVESNL